MTTAYTGLVVVTSDTQERRPDQAPYERRRSVKALKLSLFLISGFLVAEAVGGYLSNSLALLADAGHLLSDVGALVLALLAIWLAHRPTGPQRTFGNLRVEVLAAFVNGLTLLAVAVWVGYAAYHRLKSPPEVHGPLMLSVATAGFLSQAVSSVILRKAATESLNAKAAYIHVATDALQSFGTVVAGVLMVLFRWYLADPIVSMVIAVFMTWTGVRIVVAALRIMMDVAPVHIDVQKLKEALESVEGVKEVHDLHVWTVTSGLDTMSAHVVLKDGLPREEARRALAEMHRIAVQDFCVEHATIQAEDWTEQAPDDPSPDAKALRQREMI